MSAASQGLTKQGIAILQALRDFAVQDTMWRRRGVRGWAFSVELPNSAVLVDQLRTFGVRGHVIRDDVRDPFRNSPLHLHRITETGLDALARATGTAAGTIEPAGELSPSDLESLFVSPSTWAILEFLAAEQPERSFSFSEIRSRAVRPLWPDDTRFLLSRGLVVRERPDHAREFVYRATQLGRGAEAVDITTSRSMVQVHVPGISAVSRQMPSARPGAGRRPASS